MKKILAIIFALSILCITSTAFAGEYTFGSVKVRTTQNTAVVTVTATQATQNFFIEIWSIGSSSQRLIREEFNFNSSVRSGTFTLSNLSPNTEYWLYRENAGQTSNSTPNKIRTESVVLTPCPTCTFDVLVSGENVLATLSGIDSTTRDTMKIAFLPTPIIGGPICEGFLNMCTFFVPPKEILADGSIRWAIPLNTGVLTGKTKYYIRAEGLNGAGNFVSSVKEITTPDEKVDATNALGLTYTVSGDKADISGQINNIKKTDFTAKLQYSLKQFDASGETLPTEAKEVMATVGTDGKYVFKLTDLSPNRLYFVKQILRADNRGALDISVNNTGFNSTTGYKAEGSQAQLEDFGRRSYTLLAPFSEKLRIVLDPDLCRELVAQGKKTDGDCDNQVSDFINLMLSVLIGIAAVVLVIQLIIQGYVLMTSDVPFLRAGAKSRFFEALLGLLLAMSSYLILNTLNPRLVSGGLNIASINVSVNDFEISNLQTGPTATVGTKVNFKKEACPAALAAEKQTKVPAALLLAIFEQETGSGKNTGSCFPVKPNSKGQVSNMPSNQITALRSIITGSIDNINVSCDPGEGTGGAIGKMQSMPGSWLQFGRGGDPWSTNDAMIFTANHLIGGKIFTDGEKEAACRYWGGNGSSCSSTTNNGYAKKYGESVIGKRITYQKRIDNGDCKP